MRLMFVGVTFSGIGIPVGSYASAARSDAIGSDAGRWGLPQSLAAAAESEAALLTENLESDFVYSNVDALEAVLGDSRGRDPDVVVGGGDTVPGPFARATLARLQALSVPVPKQHATGALFSA